MSDARPIPEESIELLRGFSSTADVVLAVLRPDCTEAAEAALRAMAQALGLPEPSRLESGGELAQRFQDRFLVPVTPYYVPLVESSVREARMQEDHVVFGSLAGRRSDQVSACYRFAAFDWRSLEATYSVKGCLRPDALVCELAFLTALANEALREPRDYFSRAHDSASLARQFAQRHAARWFADAASYMGASDYDAYACAVAIASSAVDLVAEMPL